MKVIEVPASFDLRDLRPVERAATLSRVASPQHEVHPPPEGAHPSDLRIRFNVEGVAGG